MRSVVESLSGTCYRKGLGGNVVGASASNMPPAWMSRLVLRYLPSERRRLLMRRALRTRAPDQ